MASNVYEGMFILDSNRYARDPGAAAKRIPDLIQGKGGEMLVSRLWEERRLAYPINGQRKGTYWLTYFRLESGQLTDLTRQCEISDEILRHLFLKIDPRIVDALVEHATKGPTAKEPPAEVKEPAKAAAKAPAPSGDDDSDENDATDGE